MNGHIMQNQVVNHAVNYILGHASGEIGVDDVARVCGYSPYYLERLFKAETGEGIYSFIKRTKIEQSAFRLKVEKERSVTAIGQEYGYSSSNYATLFKKHFGRTPVSFRRQIGRQLLENSFFHPSPDGVRLFERPVLKDVWREALPGEVRMSESSALKGAWREALPGEARMSENSALKDARKDAFSDEVQISDRPALRAVSEYERENGLWDYEKCKAHMAVMQKDEYFVLYERRKGNYHNLAENWHDFLDRYKGFVREDTVMLEITYEDPSITAGDHCLYDICITVEPDDPRLVLQKTAAVGITSRRRSETLPNTMTIPGGKFAVYRYQGYPQCIYKAYQSVFCNWLSRTGYRIDNRPGYDVYHRIDEDTLYMELDICIPII